MHLTCRTQCWTNRPRWRQRGSYHLICPNLKWICPILAPEVCMKQRIIDKLINLSDMIGTFHRIRVPVGIHPRMLLSKEIKVYLSTLRKWNQSCKSAKNRDKRTTQVIKQDKKFSRKVESSLAEHRPNSHVEWKTPKVRLNSSDHHQLTTRDSLSKIVRRIKVQHLGTSCSQDRTVSPGNLSLAKTWEIVGTKAAISLTAKLFNLENQWILISAIPLEKMPILKAQKLNIQMRGNEQ